MQILLIAHADRPVTCYNLDVFVSAGYRVKSRRGTQFRIWATRTLRERGMGDLQQAMNLLARTLTSRALVNDEGRAVLEVVQRYTRSWRWLFEYDEGRLPSAPERAVAPAATIPLQDARAAIDGLRGAIDPQGEAGPLFGQERGHGLEAILGAIEQTFRAHPLLRRQRPPLLRREQADRRPAVPGVAAAQRAAGALERSAAIRRQRDGRADAAHRRERARS